MVWDVTHEGQIQFRLYTEKGPKGPNVTKRHTTAEVFLESLHTYIGGTFLLTTKPSKMIIENNKRDLQY